MIFDQIKKILIGVLSSFDIQIDMNQRILKGPSVSAQTLYNASRTQKMQTLFLRCWYFLKFNMAGTIIGPMPSIVFLLYYMTMTT